MKTTPLISGQISSPKQLKQFGLMWSVILLACSIYHFIHTPQHSAYLWYASAGLLFALAAYVYPALFLRTGLFFFWMKLGDLLHWISSHIILGAVVD
jgi:hypothetical protein